MNPNQRDFDDSDKLRDFISEYLPEVNQHVMAISQQIIYASSRLLSWEESKVAEFNITAAQANILICLLRGELQWGLTGMFPSQISEMHGSSRNSVSGLLERMENRGLISREILKEDKRRLLIQLTPEGRQIVNKLLQSAFLSYNPIAEHFDNKDLETLLTYLKHLNQAIKSLKKSGEKD